MWPISVAGDAGEGVMLTVKVFYTYEGTFDLHNNLNDVPYWGRSK